VNPDISIHDVVYVWLNRGRDNARSLSAIAETTKLSRRQVEAAVQRLRLNGYEVCSGPEGVWLGDDVDVTQTIASLRSRLRSQYKTLRAMQQGQRRRRGYQQTLWKNDAA
jgi:biotin operon repressor